MNHIQQKNWEAKQAKGMWRFILLFGVLQWGVTTALIFSLIMSVTKQDRSFLDILQSAIITFPLSGIFFGGVMWRLSQSKYEKSMKPTSD